MTGWKKSYGSTVLWNLKLYLVQNCNKCIIDKGKPLLGHKYSTTFISLIFYFFLLVWSVHCTLLSCPKQFRASFNLLNQRWLWITQIKFTIIVFSLNWSLFNLQSFSLTFFADWLGEIARFYCIIVRWLGGPFWLHVTGFLALIKSYLRTITNKKWPINKNIKTGHFRWSNCFSCLHEHSHPNSIAFLWHWIALALDWSSLQSTSYEGEWRPT